MKWESRNIHIPIKICSQANNIIGSPIRPNEVKILGEEIGTEKRAYVFTGTEKKSGNFVHSNTRNSFPHLYANCIWT
jgi:hypothetical protein